MPTPKLARAHAAICAVALACVGMAAVAPAGDEPTGSIAPISPALCDDMAKHNVLRPGVPVGCARLSLVKFAYVDFDGQTHGDGEIVVMDAAAENVLRIFAKLREMRFPIAKARLINHYDGNDDASIADNNTSAFNARNVAGTNSLSLHAYGLAIDLNPIQNPYVKRSGGNLIFSPPAGVEYANRLIDRSGKKARAGMAESVVDVFADEGFLIWGGYWHDPIDYQHFQVNRGLAERLARLSPAQARAAFAQHVERYRACRKNGESSRSKCIALDAARGRAGN
jgi:D-alanyl-D-alanine carboxypeptidase